MRDAKGLGWAGEGRRGSEGQVDRMNAHDSPETSALTHTIKRANVYYPRTQAVDGWSPERKPAVKIQHDRTGELRERKTHRET